MHSVKRVYLVLNTLHKLSEPYSDIWEGGGGHTYTPHTTCV